ncbi:MAG: tetratricopeptide repeat protein [Planctomycetota bacterium]
MNAETAYLFRHALLRDAAYQLQLPGDRARLHGMAFEAIETQAGGRPPDVDFSSNGVPTLSHPSDVFAGELAQHALRAGEPRGARQSEWTAAHRLYLFRAAAAAERGFRHAEATEHWRALAGQMSGPGRAGLLTRAARLLELGGNRAEAERLLEEAFSHSRGNARLRGFVLACQALIWKRTGRLDQAERGYRRAMKIHRETGNSAMEGHDLGNLAALYSETGRIEKAEAAFLKALAFHRKTKNRRLEGVVLGALGTLYLTTARYDEAERVKRRALAVFRAAGDRAGEGRALAGLLNYHIYRGRPDEAETFAVQALPIARECGDRFSEANVLANMGSILGARGRFPEAVNAIETALEILRTMGDVRGEAFALGSLAGVLADQGRLEEALGTYQRSLDLHRSGRDRRSEGVSLLNLAVLSHKLDRHREARTHLDEALQACTQSSNPSGEASCRCYAAALLVFEGRIEEARASWTKGAAVLRKLDEKDVLNDSLALMEAECARAGVEAID